MEDTRSYSPLRFIRLATVIAVIAVAVAVSGCSSTAGTISGRGALEANVTQDELSAGNEPYFNTGGITYQVQESRQLNPFSDDSDYFTGVKGAQSISGSDFWFGVFLWAKNQGTQSNTTASKFVLTDSAGDSYQPTTLPSINPFAWTSQVLAQNDIEPNADSIAASDSAGGGLILFKLPQSAYQNRPLTLHIYAQGASTASAVSLDL